MPVSLKKIRQLQDKALQVKPDEISRYRRHNKNSPAWWQVKVEGNDIGPLHKSTELALKYIEEQDIHHLLPAIERISINEFNRNRDTKTTKTS